MIDMVIISDNCKGFSKFDSNCCSTSSSRSFLLLHFS